MNTNLLPLLVACAVGLGFSHALPGHAADAANPPGKASPDKVACCPMSDFFLKDVPDTVRKGTFLLNARLRYEHADATTADHANAVTLRTRIGYQTPTLYHFNGLLEAEDVRVLGPKHNANFPGSDGDPDKTLVADPEETEINRAWIAYSRWDSRLKAGRQRIIRDNARFIGNVGWRQNEQTFDTISVENHSLEHFHASYGWIWRVNRIFGNVSGLLPGQKDFKSDSHILNLHYEGCPYADVGAYGYLLDLENAGGMPSSATAGIFLDGAYKLDEDLSVNYRGEVAYQEDYADNPAHYEAIYYHLKGGAQYQIFHAGVGYEVLGSDNGTVGFATPLATLHAFNGWADRFLTTPANGLKDFYLWAGVDLPGNIPLRAFYHDFSADEGSDDYGQEIDLVISKKFGPHWSLLAKYANYSAGDDLAPPFNSIHKFWLQGEFVF